MHSFLAWLAWVVVAFLPALLGLLFDPGSWYAQLDKPPWNPPGWLFGPVWTGLYLLIGTSAWLLWRRRSFRNAPGAFAVFFVQHALNAAWTPVFFGAERPGAAFVVIVAMWCAIVATVVAFARHHKVAAGLLVPYLLWVSFAAVLNLRIWQLNG